MDTALAKQLLQKIQDLEAGDDDLKQEMLKLVLRGSLTGCEIDPADKLAYNDQSDQKCRANPTMGTRLAGSGRKGGGGGYDRTMAGCAASPNSLRLREDTTADPLNTITQSLNLTEMHSLNILESMGQAVHFYDHNYVICYWNRAAEQLYGYSASEALGRCTLGLIIEERDFNEADEIGSRTASGQCYTGQFPCRNKQGKRFQVIVTIKPLYDDTGEIIGVVCVSCDSQPFRDIAPAFSESFPEDAYANASQNPRSGFTTTAPCFNTREILHVVSCSKIWKLASRMNRILFSKLIPRVKKMKHEVLHGKSSYVNPQGFRETSFSKWNDSLQEASTINSLGNSDDKGKDKIANEMVTYLRAWKGTKQHRFVRGTPTPNGVLYDEQEGDCNCQRSTEPESQIVQCSRFGGNEASGSTFSSFDSASTVTIRNSSICPLHNFDMDADSLSYDISWKDLTFGEQIGQGSSATVYHGLWCGLDVAIKVFLKLENWDGLLSCFRQELLLMKRLRHPNLLLFLGAVTSTRHPCIITEFLPRGSLFQLLQCNLVTLDWRLRVNMALDVARGMNHLHQWNPPIVHRDLKSSNLLVDKNWTVKVGDFGLSRFKHETFLTTKKWKGTTQWMAPEVIRNEPVDEKSDVYSFGVVLWELATLKIPWYGLTPMQVIAAVGFMEQRPEIPKDMNPQWASLIENCWQSKPERRPTFGELLEKLEVLQSADALFYSKP